MQKNEHDVMSVRDNTYYDYDLNLATKLFTWLLAYYDEFD